MGLSAVLRAKPGAPAPSAASPSPPVSSREPPPAAPQLDLHAIRRELLKALDRDARGAERAAEPGPETRLLLTRLHGKLAGAPAPPALQELLRRETAELAARTPAWTPAHDLLLVLDNYRYYLFDPTPCPGLELPVGSMPRERRWWHELTAARLGTVRADLRVLGETDPALLAACPESRLLSVARLWPLLTRDVPLDAPELVTLLRRALLLDPAHDDLSPGPEQDRAAHLCSELWRLTQGALRLRLGREDEGAVAAARPLFARVQAEVFEPCQAWAKGLDPEVADRVFGVMASYLRDRGRLEGDVGLVARAIALRKEHVLPYFGVHTPRGRLELIEDLLALYALRPDQSTLDEARRWLEETSREVDRLDRVNDAAVWATLRAEMLLSSLPADGPGRAAQLRAADDALANAAALVGGPEEVDGVTWGRWSVSFVRAQLLAGNRAEATGRLSRARARAEAWPMWGTLGELEELGRQLER